VTREQRIWIDDVEPAIRIAEARHGTVRQQSGDVRSCVVGLAGAIALDADLDPAGL
jgi:hypothetical protein